MAPTIEGGRTTPTDGPSTSTAGTSRRHQKDRNWTSSFRTSRPRSSCRIRDKNGQKTGPNASDVIPPQPVETSLTHSVEVEIAKEPEERIGNISKNTHLLSQSFSGQDLNQHNSRHFSPKDLLSKSLVAFSGSRGQIRNLFSDQWTYFNRKMSTINEYRL